MGIEGRSEVCGIEGECLKFDATILSDWVHLGQVSLSV
jgi:hypothetical protein